MNIQGISYDDLKNGDGVRVVIWTSGCSHKCKECHNPETWDPTSGYLFDDSVKKEIYNYLENDFVSGVTFSGGDPLYESNRDTVLNFCKELKEKYPNKTIWVYTGYLYESISDLMYL